MSTTSSTEARYGHPPSNENIQGEAAPVPDDTHAYVTLRKDAFDKLVLELETFLGLTKVLSVLFFLAIAMWVVTTFWFVKNPVTKVLLVAPASTSPVSKH